MDDADNFFLPPHGGLQKSEGLRRAWNFEAPSEEYWSNAKLTPPVVVDSFAYVEVMIKIAAGGVGKSTLMLYEAAHIVLGRPLWGKVVRRTGKVLIVSAEDPKEIVYARLREVCKCLGLAPEETSTVRNNVLVEYVGGENFRLCHMRDDMVVVAPETDDLISAVAPLKPAMIVFDPAVSFGVGETRINDAEQGLINAARRILKGVGCVIQIIHHTGQANARGKVVDAYAGRGGTAMPDGARMVQIIHPLNVDEFEKATGVALEEDQRGLAYYIPKMTFCATPEPFYIIRKGFRFDFIKAGSRRDWRQLRPEQMEQFRALYEAAVESGSTPGKDSQSSNWTGLILAKVLGLDPAGSEIKASDRTPSQIADRKRCNEILAYMRSEGILQTGEEEVESKQRTRPVDVLK